MGAFSKLNKNIGDIAGKIGEYKSQQSGLLEDSPSSPISPAQPKPLEQPASPVAPSPKFDPNRPAYSEKARYDTQGLLDSSVDDMNKLMNPDNPMMKKAATYGKQVANERGLLNSSLAAEASQSAMLDAVMPMVQQNAQTRAALTGQFADEGIRRGLVDLEMKWNNDIQNNINASSIWDSGIKAINQILNNPDMDPEQQQEALSYQMDMMEQTMTFFRDLQEFGYDRAISAMQ